MFPLRGESVEEDGVVERAVPGCLKQEARPGGRGWGGAGRGMSIKQEHTQCYSNTLCRPALSSPVCIIHLKVLGFEEVEGQHVGLVV